MRRLEEAAFGRRCQYNYGDIKHEKHTRNPSEDAVEVLVYVKLEFRVEDLH